MRVSNDGTGRGKVFTYDRITLLDTKFEPRYSICPAGEPQIDGVQAAHEPWVRDRTGRPSDQRAGTTPIPLG